MIRWRDIVNLQIFKSLNLKATAVLNLYKSNGTQVEVTPDLIANQLNNSARAVTLIAAATMTPEANGNGKINLLSLLAGFDTALPEATGSGNSYEFRVGIVNTSGDYGILALTTDTMTGHVFTVDTDSTDNVVGFAVDGTDDKLEINGTTKGGLTIGDKLVFTDIADTLWYVEAHLTGSGTIVTPAAAT